MTTSTANTMTDKICMITGSNSGIGRITALELARMGASVVLVCRNPDEGLVVQTEIQKDSNNDNVDLLVADLSSQAAIRKLAADFQGKYDKLHVLINNAGVLAKERKLTEDGLERQFAVNMLAPFLLTHLLLDPLKAGAPSRIVNVTSMMHKYAKLDFDNLQGEKKYSSQGAYNQSKLGIVLFTKELAGQLKEAGVTVNCHHPGVVATGIMRDSSRFMRILWDLTMSTPEQGAKNSIYLASSPEVAGMTGKYFEKQKEAKPSKKVSEQFLSRKWWDICAELTGIGDG